MGIVKLTAKFVTVVLMLYFLALILDGDFSKLTNIIATFRNLVQQIAAMDKQTLIGIGIVGVFAFFIFSES